MCGQVGMAGTFDHQKHGGIMRKLLVIDSFRGIDSTGLASIKRDKDEVLIAKAIGNPFNLFDTKSFDKVDLVYGAKAFLGHNRYKTQGGINLFCAHPFHYGDIVGTHNGTVPQIDVLPINHDNIETDSQAIMSSIDAVGAVETFGKLRGAWAVVFVNTKDGTINFIRNKERPLWFCYVNNYKILLWASELWMLRAIVASENLDVCTDDKGNGYFMPEADYLYTAEIPTARDGVFKTFETTPCPGKANVVTAVYSGPFYGGGNVTNHPHNNSNNVNNKANRTTWFGTPITEAEFKKKTHEGCSYCGDPVGWEDRDKMRFVDNTRFLCPSCATDSYKDPQIISLVKAC